MPSPLRSRLLTLLPPRGGLPAPGPARHPDDRAARAAGRSRGRRVTAQASLAFALALVVAACSDGAEDDPETALPKNAVVTTAEPERVLTINGPDQGALINAEGLGDLSLTVEASVEAGGDDAELATSLDDLRVLVDGDDVTAEAETTDRELIWPLAGLADGDRVITLGATLPQDATSEDDEAPSDEQDDEEDDAGDSGAARAAGLELLGEWTVTVDTTPPEVEITAPEGAVIAGDPVTIAGVTEPGTIVVIGGQEVSADASGNFELALDQAPDGALELTATDEAGNRSDAEVAIVTVPSRVETDSIRAAHVSFCGWASPSLRDPILELVESGVYTAVQLDLKDETGYIGYDTELEFAARVGSDQADCRFDLAEAVEQIHALGVPVIGRIVAFADPVLAPWAWANDERDMAIQTADGDLYTGRYNGFANFANEEVVEYNIGVAHEAAAAGVDHILWDYLRKPDGQNARFPGLEGEPMDAIVDFTRRADEAIAPYGALHGASVYGISADRPAEVAQDIVALAEHLDYMAPMIYPSHWGPGEYGVADPLNQPYDIVEATLEVWLETVEGARARIVPWLEDSNYPPSIGGPSRASYLRDQLDATYDAGINEWLLWDSAVNYTSDAIVLPDDS